MFNYKFKCFKANKAIIFEQFQFAIHLRTLLSFLTLLRCLCFILNFPFLI